MAYYQPQPQYGQPVAGVQMQVGVNGAGFNMNVGAHGHGHHKKKSSSSDKKKHHFHPQPMMQPQPMMMQPQPMYAPQPMVAGPTIIVAGGGGNTAIYSRTPQNAHCPGCNKNVMTNVTKDTTSMQWIICVVVALVAPPYCCIPFCVGDCYAAKHTCPSCNRVLGFVGKN